MRRAPLRLQLGDVPFEVMPDGRVTLPPSGPLAMPDASAPTAIFPSLGNFLATVCRPRRSSR